MALTTIKTKPCPLCGEESDVLVDPASYREWRSGQRKVQEAFQTMTASVRELLLTGAHQQCWDTMFPEGEG